MFIGDWLKARKRFTPRKCAFLDARKDKAYSYEMIYTRAGALSQFLFRRCKVQRGARVAILADNCVEYLELFFAAAKIGAILVPLSTALSLQHLCGIIGDAKPALLFFGSNYASVVDSLRSRHSEISCVNLEDAIHGEEIYPYPVEEVEVCPEDPLLLIYQCREASYYGAVLSCGMVLWNSINTLLSFGLTHNDAMLILSPMGSVTGLNMFTLPLMHAGGTVILPGEISPGSLFSCIESHPVTFLPMESHIACELSSHPYFSSADLSRVRFFISAGPVPDEAARRFHDRSLFFVQGYVLDEAGPNNFFMREQDCHNRPDSIGYPIFHVEATIADERGSMLPEGKTGELLLSGNHVFSGYWNNPRATRSAFLKGWLRTNDRAYVEDGFFYIVERGSQGYLVNAEKRIPLSDNRNPEL